MSQSTAVRDYAFFYLNGKPHKVRGADLFINFTEYLRIGQALTGTKVVCEEGDCGACSILRAFPKPGAKGDVKFEAINACIIKVGQLDGSSIVTVEGLRDLMPEGELHPAQKSMIECHGSQCGFCTPGIVVTLAGAVDQKELKTEQSVKNELTGNLCRCTGYLPIVEAGLQMETSGVKKLSKVFLTPEMKKNLQLAQSKTLIAEDKTRVFEAPANLADLRKLRKRSMTSILLGAGTDLGVATNKRGFDGRHFLSLHLVKELYAVKQTAKTLQIGARTTLTEFRKCLEKNPTLEGYMHIFASPQIKNFATVVGNVANASPIGDTPPLLLALNAEVEIFTPSSSKTRWVNLSDFYKGYKQTDLNKGEIIWSLKMTLPASDDHLDFSKISQRRDLDISCVNTGFYFKPGGKNYLKPQTLRLAFGGVGATPLRLNETEKYLLEEGLSEETLPVLLDLAQQEITPLSDLRGSENYRRLVSHGLLKKFFKQIMTKGASL